MSLVPHTLSRRNRLRRVKFIWGASHVIRGQWRFGLFGWYDRVEGKHHDGLALSLRGALLWAAGLVLTGWLGLATLLWGFWQRNPYNLLGWADAALYPIRRDEITARKGQAIIAEG